MHVIVITGDGRLWLYAAGRFDHAGTNAGSPGVTVSTRHVTLDCI